MKDMRSSLSNGIGKLVSTGLLAAAMGLATQACEAQDWAKAMLAKSPRHGEYVTIKESGGRNLQAFVVYPEIRDKAPVIVLIHEIYGESDWFKEMADELAGAGYIVVAPDLLSGFGPAGQAKMTPDCEPMDCAANGKPYVARVVNDGSDGKPVRVEIVEQESSTRNDHTTPALVQQPDHSHMQMPAANGAAMVPMSPGGTTAFPSDQVTRAVMALPDAQVLTDLDAAADYGKKLPSANGKLYVAGFCWGGAKSFLYATRRHDLSAAFVFYGTPPAADAMKNITAPVYGFYAGNDARVTTTVAQTEIDMKAAGKKYEPVTYDGAGHGFMRAGQQPDASAANTAAWNEGFRRLVSLLGGVR